VSAAPGPGPARPPGSGASGFEGAPGASPPRKDGPQNIATAITDVSERVALLVREEVELAKAEVAEKAAKLARGAVVAVAAGIFVVTALFLVLIGFAWLLYYVLPVPTFAYFWGFFAMAAILLVLGALAGLVAAKVVKKSSPPVPTMAIEEARLIRETMGSGAEHRGVQGAPASAGPYPAGGESAFPAPGAPGGGAA
jgi:uncharacterized membrane protein YqjE